MNPLNRFCQIASLLCCMVLGVEGFLFVQNLAAQSRQFDHPLASAIEQHHHTPAPAATKIAAN